MVGKDCQWLLRNDGELGRGHDFATVREVVLALTQADAFLRQEPSGKSTP